MYFRMPIPQQTGLLLGVEASVLGDEADDVFVDVVSFIIEDLKGNIVLDEIKTEQDLVSKFGVDFNDVNDYAVDKLADKVYDEWFQNKVAHAESFFEGDR